MAEKSKTRKLIDLKCSTCTHANYTLWRKKGAETKLALKKFCKWCKKHTAHKESRH